MDSNIDFYIDFERDLTAIPFLSERVEKLSQTNYQFGILKNLLFSNNSNNFKIVAFKAKTLDNVYLYMITCYIDAILIKHAKKPYQLPRGFPIILTPTMIHTYGFYPKFDNDDRSGDVNTIMTSNTMFQKLEFFKKWSGFLGMVCPFVHNANIYWTVTTKNSADCESDFVKDAKRIITPFIGDD